MRGLGVHGDPVEGFRGQAELAKQTKADKPFFHAYLRGPAEELKKLPARKSLIVNGCDTALGESDDTAAPHGEPAYR
jgi:hypothetical protein